MSGLSNKSFDRSDERRTPPLTQVDVVQLDGGAVVRIIQARARVLGLVQTGKTKRARCTQP